jgi:hypothetical protein
MFHRGHFGGIVDLKIAIVVVADGAVQEVIA